MAGMVVKAKVGELEEEVRGIFLMWLRKNFTGVIQGVYGKKMFLVRFQDGCEKYLTLNKLTVIIVDKSPVEEESEVPRIPVITDETVPS